MKQKSAILLRSVGIQELTDLFNDLSKPYGQGEGEVVRFNLAYQRIYPHLNSEEKLCAEKLVDTLLVNLENEKLASRVYGVV
jgi:hypothetical protein